MADLRKHKALTFCLTNLMTMEFAANSLLAVGMVPIMSLCEDELAELLKKAKIYLHEATLHGKDDSVRKRP